MIMSLSNFEQNLELIHLNKRRALYTDFAKTLSYP